MRCSKLWIILSAVMIAVTADPHLVSGQTLSQKLSDYMKNKVENQDFSGSVAVYWKGEPLIAAGYGTADRELSVPNSSKTVFRIGSVTKQFTSMAIMILQERGKLHVTDPIGKHLDSIPATWEELTIHQLLTHTSGIMHSWALAGFRETMAVTTTLDATLARYYDKPLLFEPGMKHRYSGVGYFTLAKIIEVVSGEKYHDFLQREIFDPLGMKSSGGDRPEVILMHRAAGYNRNDSGIFNAAYIYMPVLTGGGDLYSTIEDLVVWSHALNEGRLISRSSYEMMYRPALNNYSYGWVVAQQNGHNVYSHSGGVPGFNAHLLRIPDFHFCAVIISNVAPTPVRKMAQEIVLLVFGDE